MVRNLILANAVLREPTSRSEKNPFAAQSNDIEAACANPPGRGGRQRRSIPPTPQLTVLFVSVTVTAGLLAVMNREELEGVLAHEMSHIKNYDTRLLLVVTTLIGMAGLIAGMIWRSAFLMRSRGRDGAQLVLLVLAAGALLSVVGFVVGPVIRLALSRRRESLADASAVDLCRNPAGLLGALRKLQTNDVPLVRVNHATAAMCIDDPLQHHEGAMHRLYDTHPPIAERIAVLEHMQQGLTV